MRVHESGVTVSKLFDWVVELCSSVILWCAGVVLDVSKLFAMICLCTAHRLNWCTGVGHTAPCTLYRLQAKTIQAHVQKMIEVNKSVSAGSAGR